MKARLTFLSGALRGQRRVLKDQAITIGGDRTHCVYLPNMKSSDLVALITYHDCEYTLESHKRGAVTVNDDAVRTRVLEEGDLIRVAGTELMRFTFAPEKGDACKPIRYIGQQEGGADHDEDGQRPGEPPGGPACGVEDQEQHSEEAGDGSDGVGELDRRIRPRRVGEVHGSGGRGTKP